MSDSNESVSRSTRFRSAIVAFIEARREAKLKGKDDDPALAVKYEPDTWLADAARRVAQIQAVTHILKATHPDAKGSSLHVLPSSLPAHAEIGSHLLGDGAAEDVVGNAAALDVFKFLKVEVEGRRLLDWMNARDADLQQALHSDPATAHGWMAAFSELVRQDGQAQSHVLAKQAYWLVGDNPADDADYHLLQPLFASSFAHVVHSDIQEARFGEAAKAARQARWQAQAHDAGYAEYRGLAARKLGGSKPQNVSQLNSERGGVNYLLASLPPQWKQTGTIRLMQCSSAMDSLLSLTEVRTLKRALIDLLRSNPDPTLATRQQRERIEQALGEQLAVFAATVQEGNAPGWTRSPDCELALCEQVWLDPERAELPLRDDHLADDLAFKAALEARLWPDQVAERFGNWVNGWLRAAGLVAVGDTELKHWARQAVLDMAWPTPMQRRAGALS